MTALRATFYSYKGGVGRTLALLNTAALLAVNGRRVVAVDLDLEAPGFGLSALTACTAAENGRGVTDLLLDRVGNGRTSIDAFCSPLRDPRLPGLGDRLVLMPVGRNSGWLASTIPTLYEQPSDDKAELFLLLVDEIEAGFAPDLILFDSRTGHADVAGVALLELAQVVVAVSGVNEQNVAGSAGMLARIREHPARRNGVLTLVALSAVPALRETGTKMRPPLQDINVGGGADGPDVDVVTEFERLLSVRIGTAMTELVVPVMQEFGEQHVRKNYPAITKEDVLHVFPYDPYVPVSDELQILRSTDLTKAYGRLADVLARAKGHDEGIPHLKGDPPSLKGIPSDLFQP